MHPGRAGARCTSCLGEPVRPTASGNGVAVPPGNSSPQGGPGAAQAPTDGRRWPALDILEVRNETCTPSSLSRLERPRTSPSASLRSTSRASRRFSLGTSVCSPMPRGPGPEIFCFGHAGARCRRRPRDSLRRHKGRLSALPSLRSEAAGPQPTLPRRSTAAGRGRPTSAVASSIAPP